MRTEGGQTTVYVGKYYEKNTSTGNITTYYYLGDSLVALRNGSNLRYVHTDNLGSTSVVTDSSGAQYGYTRYYPYGSTRDSGGSLDTSKKFTGQRLDGTGLYYYGARYYDPVIGRFISPDTMVPDFHNPQSLNRYSYAFNNPLKYTDPTGNWPHWGSVGNFFKGVGNAVVNTVKATAQMVVNPVQTVKAAAHAVTHPAETVRAIAADYSQRIHSAEGIGSIVGDVLIMAATSGIGGVGGVGEKVIASVAEKDVVTELKNAAGRAIESVGPGKGGVCGTKVHSAFKAEVEALGRDDLTTEVSYLNGVKVDYGTPGSVRLDVVQGPLDNPIAAFDLKTGSAQLTLSRINEILSHLPRGFIGPIMEIRP